MKRVYLCFIVLIAVLSAPAMAKQKFEFWTTNFGELFEVTKATCEAFNASQTKWEIKCTMQGSYEEVLTKATAAYRAKKHPALILFYDVGTADLMMSGSAIPAYKVVPDGPWESYAKAAKTYYQDSKGRLWAQPYNGSTLFFYGNKIKLAKIGVHALPKTWEEFEGIAEKLKANGEKCIFATDFFPWYIAEQFSARHNIALATKNNGYGGLDAQYTLTGGLLEKHMANLVKWRKAGYLSLNEDTKQGQQHRAFNAGECVFMEASTGSYGDVVKSGVPVLFGKTMMYQGYKRYNQFIGGAAIWTMRGHEDKLPGIKAFLDFVRQPKWQQLVSLKTGYLPLTSDTVADMRQRGLLEGNKYGTVQDGFAMLNAPLGDNSQGTRLGFYTQFRKLLQTEMKKAAFGKQTVRQALLKVEKEGNKLLRRFQRVHRGKKLP